MKIKYISKSVLALAFFTSVVSCTKELDIEPRQNISAETALSSPADVQNAMVGAYAVMGGPALYGTNLLMIPDLYAGDAYLDWIGTFDSYGDISSKSLISTNAEANRTWIAAYRAINIANTVLSALDIVTDPADRERIEGEALFVRGIMHFELVRIYALPYENGTPNTQLGVPISLKAIKSTGDVDALPRSTVAEVYAQIEADLSNAVSKLPEENSPGATTYSASAFMSRVLLQQQKYAEARDAANTVIQSGSYSLLPNLETPFRVKNSAENIFEIEQDEQTNAGTSNDGLATFYASLDGIGRADARINPAFVNSFAANDKRRTELIYSGDAGARPGSFTQKWTDYYGNIPLARITEMYLTRAEANLRLNSAVGNTPADDINLIRVRAGLAPLTAPTITDILNEREKELAFEGFRLHDYKRTKRSVGNTPYNSPVLVFPIPDREVNANPSLEQNPGY